MDLIRSAHAVSLALEATTGRCVRLGYVRRTGEERHGLPVEGAFVDQGGRIVRWTDRWDSSSLATTLSGEDDDPLVLRC